MINEKGGPFSLREKKITIPEIQTDLRKDTVLLPPVIRKCSGIRIFGKRIKSIIYTTDIAIIRNTDADAVIAVYPFTPHPTIIECITSAADIPVFSGIGGGTTQGQRCVYMGLFAEAHGSLGVVLNGPTPTRTIQAVAEVVDVPIIGTVTSKYSPLAEKIAAGVSILNVSGGRDTASVVAFIRESYPDIPIIATGGPTDESIEETIAAGANAITYTPPTNGALFSKKMDKYRQQEMEEYQQQ